MIENRPPVLFIILAILALLVIWIPVLQQISGDAASSAFSMETWIGLSLLASIGIGLLFLLLYLLSRRR